MSKTAQRMAAARNRQDLAEKLIAHHLRMSIPDPAGLDRLAQAYAEAELPVRKMERGTRCIAVVGAGASLPVMGLADELADELEELLGRDEIELERLELVHRLDRAEFETRLLALSRNAGDARRVRETISEKFEVEHPTLLTYELLAHLLKHRFIDAIISFNFDELLDRSLEDELRTSEYKRLVSERDCRRVVTDPYSVDYVPLYIKLHGTAGEPDSLRFTLEDYYSLPNRLAARTRELLETEHCVIVNVGCRLASFDFQRMLAVPDHLAVFDLSKDPMPTGVCREIEKVRSKCGSSASGDAGDGAHVEADTAKEDLPKWLKQCNEVDDDSSTLLKQLTDAIKGIVGEPSDGLVQFRSTLRHEAVAALLGPEALTRRHDATDPGEAGRRTYCYRRTILELAFAGAKGRGILSLGPLADDRPARYYDEYHELAGRDAHDWASLCSAAGLAASRDAPDRVVSVRALRHGTEWVSGKQTAATHLFDPEKLAKHVLSRVKNRWSNDDLRLLVRTIRRLQTDTEVEIHALDDRVCSKAFRQPTTLTTTTALEVYRWLILYNMRWPADAVFVSDENGDWLLNRQIQPLLVDREKLQVLLAFGDRKAELEDAYPQAQVRVGNPWRHNRHMVISCRDQRPQRAIYYARRLRTPVVTPVYLRGLDDVMQLAGIFQERWKEAHIETLADALAEAAAGLLEVEPDGFIEGQRVAKEIGRGPEEPEVFEAFRMIERRGAPPMDPWPNDSGLPAIRKYPDT